MDRSAPADLVFQAAYAIDPPGEVALEDYARVLTRAASAETLRSPEDPERVGGVRLVSPGAELTASLRRDVEDFARDLAGRGGASGLGWA
jgi:hypothetical protein